MIKGKNFSELLRGGMTRRRQVTLFRCLAVFWILLSSPLAQAQPGVLRIVGVITAPTCGHIELRPASQADSQALPPIRCHRSPELKPMGAHQVLAQLRASPLQAEQGEKRTLTINYW